jgi:hypothetical protein
LRVLAIACALAVLGIAGALLFVLARARRLKARHLRAFGAKMPMPPDDKDRIYESGRALYHGTRFADGERVLVPAWSEPCVADLFCTEDALFLAREGGGPVLWIPLRDVQDAELHRAFAELAGKDLPRLRLRWLRGGELLETGLSLQGGMASLEALRRQIHLRQANVVEKVLDLYRRPPGG